MKKKPSDWASEKGIIVLDPDGWRRDDTSFEEPCTEGEFMRRMMVSTIMRRAPE